MARRNATANTTILLSVPPLGTRPGIKRDWDQIVSWARGIGLHLTDYHNAALTYVSPPFEQNAFVASGVPNCPFDWRRGDLAIFTCEAMDYIPRSIAFGPESRAWQEIVIGNVSVRIRPAPPSDGDDAILKILIPGNVLHSVSRRDPLLNFVNVWTSGNRVFKTSQLSKLVSVLNAIVKREWPETSLSKYLEAQGLSETAEVANQLLDIFEIEEYELVDWKRQTNADMA